MKLEIFENNPSTFLIKFIEAVNNGYRLQDTNEGHVQDCVGVSGWFQAALEKDDAYEVESIQVGKHVVEAYDRQEFFRSVQTHTLNAAEFNFNSLQYDVRGIKMIKCVIRPSVSYTREELDSLPWGDFKELAKKYSVFNRNRGVCTNMLVKVFEEV